LLQLGDHVEAQDISLAFFQGASLLLQGLPHLSLTIDSVLDPEPVGHFVEHDVGKERIEVEVASLVLGDELVSHRQQDLLKLGLHGILEL